MSTTVGTCRRSCTSCAPRWPWRPPTSTWRRPPLASTTSSEQQLAAARRGLERLARTVDDLAVHGRLAVAGDGSVDLAHEARALAGEHTAMAVAHRLTLDVEVPERLVVVADRAAVRTAVGNLLTNALRLAPVGSIVRLAAGQHADWAWIAVRDEGPGLADADHERAFHRYWRGRYDVDRDGEAARRARPAASASPSPASSRRPRAATSPCGRRSGSVRRSSCGCRPRRTPAARRSWLTTGSTTASIRCPRPRPLPPSRLVARIGARRRSGGHRRRAAAVAVTRSERP